MLGGCHNGVKTNIHVCVCCLPLPHVNKSNTWPPLLYPSLLFFSCLVPLYLHTALFETDSETDSGNFVARHAHAHTYLSASIHTAPSAHFTGCALPHPHTTPPPPPPSHCLPHTCCLLPAYTFASPIYLLPFTLLFSFACLLLPACIFAFFLPHATCTLCCATTLLSLLCRACVWFRHVTYIRQTLSILFSLCHSHACLRCSSSFILPF